MSRRFHLGINRVSPQRFRSHLQFLGDSGLSIIPLRGLSEGSPANSVCLTFDDGYASFYDEVLPILSEGRLPATLFVISDYIGRANDWDVTLGLNRRRHLDWDQIREAADRGIEIGSHGRTHRDLSRLAPGEMRRELEGSKKTLEDRLGREVSSLALPFGAATLEVFLCARELGYREICGGMPGLKGPLPGVLPRMPVYRGDTTRALRRKLEMTPGERLRLNLLQSCSMATRWLKQRTG